MDVLKLQALNNDPDLGLYLPSQRHSIISSMTSLKESAHSILYVVDSMGMDVLSKELHDLFENHGKITSSVFPSVTPVAFTSILTSLFPEKHKIHGHVYYSPVIRDLYDFLRYPETQPPYLKKEILQSLQDISSWTNNINQKQLHTYLPEHIIKGAFTKILFKTTQIHPYKNLSAITPQLYNIIKSSESSLQIVYINDLDDIIHEYGKTPIGFNYVNTFLQKFMKHVHQLYAMLKKDQHLDVKCTITADHGQINTPNNKILSIKKDYWDNLKQHLYVKAIGHSGRVYHVFTQITKTDKVISLLEQAYSKYSVIITEQDLSKQLQCKPTLFPTHERKQGVTPIHIIMKPQYSLYDCNVPRLLTPTRANHGSLSKEELLVPEITCTFNDMNFVS